MSILLNRFFYIRDKVLKEKEILTPIELFEILREWANGVKNSKDHHVINLYSNYLIYYEAFDDLQLYDFSHLKNSFQTLLECSFLKASPPNIESAVVIVGDLLWNLIVFRSDRLCPEGPHGYLRVLTDETKSVVYFCCDVTSYVEDLGGKQVKPFGKLIVANASQIEIYKIKPAEDWDI